MGVTVSKTQVTVEGKKRHEIAEKIIAEEKKKNQNIFKLLLLGPGDSGKSTVIKQMRILHANGFKDEEVKHYQTLIIGNIIISISSIIRAMNNFGIKFGNNDREMDADFVLILERTWHDNQWIQTSDWDRLRALWADSGVQECYGRANQYQVHSSTKYFCDSMDRISEPKYIPTQQDILYSRATTVGIIELEFTLRGLTLKVIDVGGQRSQRKKWIHCFENISALIYVAAISEYNQVLEEDNTVNRLFESIKLFSLIINSRWFVKTSVVLFLNKKDIFQEKLDISPLEAIFPKYTGGTDREKAYVYVEERFLREVVDQQKRIYTHRTCATDTKNIEFVLASSFDILLANGLSKSGLF